MRSNLWIVACLLLGPVTAGGAAAQQAGGDLALDSLLSVQVSAAARYDQTAAEAPASVTVMTSEEIRMFGWRTLADVLAAVRGFYTADDRNYAYVGVRGFGRPTDYNDRLLLLLDGLPLNDAFYGAAPVGMDLGIDLATLERIEIVRGPGSALYGSNAMLGVINLVSRGAAPRRQASARASVGTAGLVDLAAEAGDRWNDAELWLSVGREVSSGDDFWFPELQDSSIGMDDEESTHARLRARMGDLTLRGRLSRRWKTVPTGAWGTSLHDPRGRTLDEWEGVDLAWAPRLDAARMLDVRASVARYYYAGWYPDDDGALADDENEVLSGRLASQLVWDLRPENRLMLGAEWRHHGRAYYRASDADGVYFEGDFPHDEWSLMAQDEHHVTPELVVTGGVRYDHSGLSSGRPTVRGAAVWTPSQANTFKLLYGEAFRSPNVYEAHYEDTYGPFLPSTGLRPEVARTAEIVWERRLGGPFWGTLSAFDTHISGLIDTHEEEDGTTWFTNLDEVDASGIEAELQGRWGAGRLVRLSYAWTRARIEGAEPSNSPAHVVRAAFGRPLVGPISLASEVRYESGRLTLRDTRTDGALLVDLHLATPISEKGLAAWVGVRNLLNEDYAVPAGYEHVQSVIPQPGRRLAVGMEYRH